MAQQTCKDTRWAPPAKSPLRPLPDPKPFQHLASALKQHFGSVERTCKEVGVSERSFNRLFEDGHVCKQVGQKLLDCYTRTRPRALRSA